MDQKLVSKPMAKKIFELYRDGKIDTSCLTNAINKHWITEDEAKAIRDHVDKKAE